jgi:hypothetical protein
MITRWIAMALAALLFAGCGKKSESPAPAPATQPAVEPAPADQTSAMDSNTAPALVQPVQADMGPVLDRLTQVLRKYCFENKRLPATFDEVVAAGYVKDMPQAPAGKKFAIDPKKVQIILVNQ